MRAVEAPHTARKRGAEACGETKTGAGLGLGGERLTGPVDVKMPQAWEEVESEEFRVCSWQTKGWDCKLPYVTFFRARK